MNDTSNLEFKFQVSATCYVMITPPANTRHCTSRQRQSQSHGRPELEGACLNTSHLVHLEERICLIRIFFIKALRHVKSRGVLPLDGDLQLSAHVDELAVSVPWLRRLPVK